MLDAQLVGPLANFKRFCSCSVKQKALHAQQLVTEEADKLLVSASMEACRELQMTTKHPQLGVKSSHSLGSCKNHKQRDQDQAMPMAVKTKQLASRLPQEMLLRTVNRPDCLKLI